LQSDGGPYIFPRKPAEDDGVRWLAERWPSPPAPFPERGGDGYSRPEADGGADHKAGPRTSEDDDGVIVRYVEHRRVQR
jgi:hypothetical protein